jgi:hypothetical protein
MTRCAWCGSAAQVAGYEHTSGNKQHFTQARIAFEQARHACASARARATAAAERLDVATRPTRHKLGRRCLRLADRVARKTNALWSKCKQHTYSILHMCRLSSIAVANILQVVCLLIAAYQRLTLVCVSARAAVINLTILATLNRHRAGTGQPRKRRRYNKAKAPASAEPSPRAPPLTAAEVSALYVADFWSCYWCADGAGPTVIRFVAARRIQCMARCHASRCAAAAAHSRAQQRAAEAVTAAVRARAAAQARALHYRSVCRAEAQCVLTRAIKHFLLPYAVLDVQRCWRGYQSRCALALRLEALARNAIKRTERDRYLRALKALRREKRRRVQPRVSRVRRRVFGRSEFDHSGWHPGDSTGSADVSNNEVLSQHVWSPPAVTASGLRIDHIKLPAHSEWDKQLLQQQQQQQSPAAAAAANSTLWVGIPVATAARRQPKKPLGPPPRPGTVTAVSAKWAATKSVVNSDSSSSSAGAGQQQRDEFVTKYSWLPASLVFGSGKTSNKSGSSSAATAAVTSSSAKTAAAGIKGGDKRGVQSGAASTTAKAIG